MALTQPKLFGIRFILTFNRTTNTNPQLKIKPPVNVVKDNNYPGQKQCGTTSIIMNFTRAIGFKPLLIIST